MSGKPNLNFPILSFETCFNLLPDAQPSFESNPPSQWHTFLFVQTWRNNECTSNTTWKSCKKKVFLHSTWGKKKGFYFVSSCFSTALIGAIRSLLFNSVICSLGGSLSAVGLRRSTSNINCLFYHWTSFDFIRSFINKQLNTFHFKQLLIHTWCLSFYVLLEIKQRIFWNQSNIILRIEHNLSIFFLRKVEFPGA